jgi:hypothetical protein
VIGRLISRVGPPVGGAAVGVSWGCVSIAILVTFLIVS